MKIMYFMDHYQNMGGAANTILMQAELMKKNGASVIIVLSDYVGSICEEYIERCQKCDIEFVRCTYPVANQPEDLDVIGMIEDYPKVKGLIELIHPDLLHSVQLNPLVELVSRELGIPHVMNIYPLIADFFAMEFLDIIPQYHICDSEYYAMLWQKYAHTESECIRTVAIRDGVKKEKRDDCTKFVCVGAVYEQKNQLSVIMAFAMALRRGLDHAKLYIYGHYDNNYGKECNKYIVTNHLEDNVFLMGYCNEMNSVYQDSDVLICGSTRESYPNVISESLANGLTIITTPVAGVPEVIKDGVNGYVSCGFNPEDICEKIMQFRKDQISGFLTNICNEAEKTYQMTHSPEIVTKQLNTYYDRLISNYQGKNIISIDFMRSKFSKVIELYHQNLYRFSQKESVRLKLWYIFHMSNCLNSSTTKNVDYYIWGAGKYGSDVLEIATVFFENIKIKGFIDSVKEGTINGFPIYKPEDIMDEDCIIFIGVFNQQREIIKILESHHKEYCKNYYLLTPRIW